jgi:hypothetical protein
MPWRICRHQKTINLTKTKTIMPISSNSKITQSKIFKLTVCSSVMLFTILGLLSLNNQTTNKHVQAAAANSSNIIIGTKDMGAAVELTVCLQSTSPSPIHLANVSNWFAYNSADLTPSPTILEVGKFGVTGNTVGYGKLKWTAIPGTSTSTYGLTLSFSPDSGSGTGELISTTPELFGKVKFDKVTASSPSSSIMMSSNVFYSVEDTNLPMTQTVSNVVGDCRTSINTTSSTLAAPKIGLPNYSYTVTGNLGTNAQTIYLNGNTFQDGTAATFTPAGATTAITGKIQSGNFVPDAGQIIPAGTLAGNQNGTLRVSGQSVQIPTNYLVAPAPTVPTNSGSGGVITINTTTQNTVAQTAPVVSNPAPIANTSDTNTSKVNPVEIATPKVVNITKATTPSYDMGVDNAIVRTGGMDVKTTAILVLVMLSVIITGYKIYKNQTNLKFDRNLRSK